MEQRAEQDRDLGLADPADWMTLRNNGASETRRSNGAGQTRRSLRCESLPRQGVARRVMEWGRGE